MICPKKQELFYTGNIEKYCKFFCISGCLHLHNYSNILYDMKTFDMCIPQQFDTLSGYGQTESFLVIIPN